MYTWNEQINSQFSKILTVLQKITRLQSCLVLTQVLSEMLEANFPRGVSVYICNSKISGSRFLRHLVWFAGY